VYMTQDIGTAILRFEDHPDLKSSVYTVGNEQEYHFKVLFLILKKLVYDWAERLYHLSYGMVDLPEGKMKSREGTVVDADDLMLEMSDAAREMTEELGKLEDMAEVDKKELFHMIGMAALKYYLLKVDPKKKILFDPKSSIDLNGNTGPFIQYTHARIRSLLRKVGEMPSVIPSLDKLGKTEKELIISMNRFPYIVKEAGANFSPALVANYIYDLVKQYNHFYQTSPVIKEENEDLRTLRVIITKATGDIVKNGMALLGIQVPDRM
jgi:arginyl-tRNA synthetase